MQKSKLNINVNRDDHQLNDYLYCWSELGERPNKLTLYSHYESTQFLEYVSKLRSGYNGLFTEVVPTGQDYIVNEKSLIKLKSDIFLAFNQYDKLTDESIIGEVSLIYKNSAADEINKILGI